MWKKSRGLRFLWLGPSPFLTCAEKGQCSKKKSTEFWVREVGFKGWFLLYLTLRKLTFLTLNCPNIKWWGFIRPFPALNPNEAKTGKRNTLFKEDYNSPKGHKQGLWTGIFEKILDHKRVRNWSWALKQDPLFSTFWFQTPIPTIWKPP